MAGKTFITQRAYTLRLDGLEPKALAKLPEPERKAAQAWREALWRTHLAVNAGAKAFGDWLLTMRGGLSPKLADEAKSDVERRNRRVLLTLGWLSVESRAGAPEGFRVEPKDTLQALLDILEKEGVPPAERESWSRDCAASLKAAIRDDAVWVNRRACFEAMRKELGPSFTSDEVAKAIFEMLETSKSYFRLQAVRAEESQEEDGEGSDNDDGAKSSNAGRGWLSFNWGTGEKSDHAAIAANLNKLTKAKLDAGLGQPGPEILVLVGKILGIEDSEADLADRIRLAVGWKSGRPSKGRMALDKIAQSQKVGKKDLEELQKKLAEEARAKGTEIRESKPWTQALKPRIQKTVGFDFVTGKDRIDEYSVILDHALRRVSGAHSWIKNAEQERLRFEADAKKMDGVPAGAKTWLDTFCGRRGAQTHALEPYRIRKRALGGWKELVAEWNKLADGDTLGRIQAARNLQGSLEDEKFGDIQLFEALAEEDALCVWKPEGKADAQALLDYAAASEAQAKQRCFKVPAYRHPDPLLHPVFCDFGNSRWDITFKVHQALAKGKPLTEEELRRVDLTLWHGQALVFTPLRWRSKKLHSDLALGTRSLQGKAVTRFDRLGRAAAGLKPGEKAAVAHLFQEKEWNGRLQAPRAQLEALAALLRKSGGAENEKIRRLRDRIQWFVSFSARLQAQGPWLDYAAEQGIKLNKYGWPKVVGNKGRLGRSKLWLQRLSGLRVLSVDLGHRYAAACAVWQVCSQKELEKACQAAGQPSPDQKDLWFMLKQGKKATLYRRIGMDSVTVDEATGEVYPHAKPHPGPWARLDRQFLVKLQGEDKPARRATPEEIARVDALEKTLGKARQQPRQGASRRVDALQAEAVELCRQGLRRHADAARIAYNLTATVKLLPGGQSEPLSPEGRMELLTDTLALWRSRFGSGRWQDVWAREMWEKDPSLKAVAPPEGGEAEGGKARKARQEQWEQSLRLVAQEWVSQKRDLTPLAAAWTAKWREQDAQWRGHLRWLRDWLLPSGAQARSKLIRQVGGLSIARIATLKGLYQVQKAYAMRPEPHDLRKNIPAKGEDGLEGFAQGVLTAMERLRENRVKQLASRLAAAALGLGPEPGRAGKLKQRLDDPRYAPCHAIVVEDLEHYRPEEVRARRENRQLMDWASAKVFKYLKEACELNGLHLRQVNPSYTSRQDSRTGAPGLRCQDVPAYDFIKGAGPWSWAQKVEQARQKGDAYGSFLEALWDAWKDKDEAELKKKLLRLPMRGGEIFVSADPRSGAAKGLQADLNAAANIGLKALMDPDWPGAWWYVPCERQVDGSWRPMEEKVKGSLCPGLKDREPLWKDMDASASQAKKKQRKGDRKPEPMNLWRDPSATPIHQGGWFFYQAYQKSVENRVLAVLRRHNGLE